MYKKKIYKKKNTSRKLSFQMLSLQIIINIIAPKHYLCLESCADDDAVPDDPTAHRVGLI
jgi:hypothetical protein